MVTPMQMTAASWESKGSIDMVNKDVPALQPGQVLIRVAASGICGELVYKGGVGKQALYITQI